MKHSWYSYDCYVQEGKLGKISKNFTHNYFITFLSLGCIWDLSYIIWLNSVEEININLLKCKLCPVGLCWCFWENNLTSFMEAVWSKVYVIMWWGVMLMLSRSCHIIIKNPGFGSILHHYTSQIQRYLEREFHSGENQWSKQLNPWNYFWCP